MIVDQMVTVLRSVPLRGKLQDVLVLSARRLALVFEVSASLLILSTARMTALTQSAESRALHAGR